MKNILTSILLITVLSVNSQVGIGAGFGTDNKGRFTGMLQVGYKLNNWQAALDMRSTINDKPAYFGVETGPVIALSETFFLKPYGGLWYKYVGNSAKQDRYVVNGESHPISANREVNGKAFGGGIQIVKKYFFIDAGYVERPRITFGVRYIFNRLESN